jgi:hypothetical protein
MRGDLATAMDDGIDGICELALEADDLDPMVEFYDLSGDAVPPARGEE